MKKLVALVMSLCLLMMSGVVLAETPTVTEINWSDYEAIAAQYPGKFVQLNQVALAFYLPDCLQEQELTEAEVNDEGYLAYFTDAERGWNVAVQYMNIEGMGLADVAEMLNATEGVANLSIVTVNGIECINYDYADQPVTVMTYVTEAGYGLEFVFGPLNDEDAMIMATAMAASIQPIAE